MLGIYVFLLVKSHDLKRQTQNCTTQNYLTCMANGIPVIFGTVHVSKFQNVSVNKITCLMLFSLYKINR